MSISQWIRVPRSTILGDANGEGGAGRAPLWSMQYIDPVDQSAKESVSIWAEPIPGNPDHYRFSARQSGKFTPLWGLEGIDNVAVPYNTYQHITFTLGNYPTNNADVPGMQVDIRVHPDDAIVRDQDHTYYRLLGSANAIQNYRDEMSAWLWNAAAMGAKACSDPNAANFNPLELGGDIRYCEYELSLIHISEPTRLV